jgi:hypothetical protein
MAYDKSRALRAEAVRALLAIRTHVGNAHLDALLVRDALKRFELRYGDTFGGMHEALGRLAGRMSAVGVKELVVDDDDADADAAVFATVPDPVSRTRTLTPPRLTAASPRAARTRSAT